MSFKNCVAVLGGDARQASLSRYFEKEGLTVHAFGLPKEKIGDAVLFEDWREAIRDVCAVILPLPASADGKQLHMPLSKDREKPLLSDIFSAVSRGVPVAGGKFSPAVKVMAQEMGVALFDYFECEELKLKNAYLTAEGAISILMREVPRAVRSLPVLVTGYGRIARFLSELLLAMGADVTVCARKRQDVATAAEKGCKTVLLTSADSVVEAVTGKSVVFNTVPHWLFTKEVLSRTPSDVLIIDLSSAPGGVDPEAALVRGIRVIFALSLPGKYAPESAGEMIGETVFAELSREGIL